MVANKFQKGDVVVVKSGGPPMTVDGVPGEVGSSGYARETYSTIWFKGASKETGNFAEHLLDKYVPPAKK